MGSWWSGSQKEEPESRPSQAVTTPPSPKIDERELKMLRKRSEAVREMVKVEKNYVDLLENIIEGPVKAAKERSDLFNSAATAKIFTNIESVYKQSKQFYEKLEKATEHCTNLHEANVGQLFADHEDGFKVYMEYCRKNPDSKSELSRFEGQEQQTQILEESLKSRKMSSIKVIATLSGHLYEPVQRITKYPTQLEDLLKHTPERHADRKWLEEALDIMKDIASDCNKKLLDSMKVQSMTELDNWQSKVKGWKGPKLITTSSERIWSGNLSKVKDSGKAASRKYFLFDHLLVECEKNLAGQLAYKERYETEGISVTTPEQDHSNNNSDNLVIELRKNDEIIRTLCTKDQEIKLAFVRAMKRERQMVKEDRKAGFKQPSKMKRTKSNAKN